ncbi:MAG: hypothetical protein BWY82_01581 [Verrucomicrobia bacterium ADurb.Bin474]|nr:MAG: hypothetical protein BWY82_01581 [Verrucomicrobia bacterium ADurb.Bin474]
MPLGGKNTARIPVKGNAGSGKVEGFAVQIQDYLYLIGIRKILGTFKRMSKRSQRYPITTDQLRKLEDLSSTDQWFIRLDVDHRVSPHDAVGFSDPVGPTRMVTHGHNRRKPVVLQHALQIHMVHRKIQRIFGHLRANPPRRLNNQRHPLDRMEQLSGKTGGSETAGHDDGGIHGWGRIAQGSPLMFPNLITGAGFPVVHLNLPD